jgi:hypothetical protein
MTQQMRPPGAPKINIPSAAPNTTTNGGAASSTTPTSEPSSVAPSTTPAIAGLPSIPSILATSPYDTSQPRVNTLYPLAGPPIFAPNESLFSPAKEPDYSPQYTILGAEPPHPAGYGMGRFRGTLSYVFYKLDDGTYKEKRFNPPRIISLFALVATHIYTVFDAEGFVEYKDDFGNSTKGDWPTLVVCEIGPQRRDERCRYGHPYRPRTRTNSSFTRPGTR